MTNYLVNDTDQTTTDPAAFTLAAGDSLVVTTFGIIAGLTASGDGVLLSGAATIVNQGLITGRAEGVDGNVAGSGSQSIHNTATGLIHGGDRGISLFAGSGHRVENDGEVIGDAAAVFVNGGNGIVRNSGTMSSKGIAVSAQGDGYTFTNTGAVFSDSAGFFGIGDSNTVVNNGTIAGGANPFTYAVVLGQGRGSLTNTGVIEVADSSSTAVYFAQFGGVAAQNTIHNTGTIIGGLGLGSAISGSFNSEVITNAGLIVGDSFLGSGDDLFDGTAGRQGLVFGFLGNDTLLGGDGADVLRGGDGLDSLAGGAGNDTITGDAGADTLEGGDGRDLLDYRNSAAAVDVSLLLGTGTGGDAAGDVFSGFEWLAGGGGGDTLTGDNGDNRLFGLLGDDLLSGGTGNDTLVGGDGNDFLVGGAGIDVLTGGTGNDRFRYLATSESAGSLRDVVTDFTAGDHLDLIAIDAIAGGGAANDAFAFVTTAAFTAAGQVRAAIIGSNTYVYANTDANLATSEMVIVLRGAIALAASDFYL